MVKSSLPIKKPAHIPVQKFLKNSRLKEIFTESLEDIIGVGPKKVNSMGVARNPATKRKFEDDDESKPSIGCTEAEFMRMIILQPTVAAGQKKMQKMCHLCKYKPASMLALFSHMQSHFGELTESCIHCNMKLSSKQALISHMKIAHVQKPPICTICEADFQTKDQLYDHINKHRKVKPFGCSYCDQKLSTMEALRKHLKSTHDTKSVKELNNVCKTCDVYFYTKDHLLIHRINQNHDTVEPLQCSCCLFTCNGSHIFRNHLWEHTNDQRESINMVICEICHKVFFSNLRLQYHMDAKHGGNKPTMMRMDMEVPVPVTKQNNIPYQQQPKEDEEYICERCSSTFKSADMFEKHRQLCSLGKDNSTVITTQAKPQQQQVQQNANECVCSLCGRKFSNLRLLTGHMKIHSGNKPVFQCEECGQIYGKKQQVLDHIKTDHAEQVQQHQQQQLQIQVPQQMVQIMQQVETLPHQQIETLQHEQVETLQASQHQVVEGTGTTAWGVNIKSPMKMATVDQDAVYSLMQMTDF